MTDDGVLRVDEVGSWPHEGPPAVIGFPCDRWSTDGRRLHWLRP